MIQLFVQALGFMVFFLIAEPFIFGIARLFGLYTIVQEREAKVFVLFGKVIGVIDSPGLHILPFKIGPMAFVINFLGRIYSRDLRLTQKYLRSNPVNSEEGAPMGVGVWYECFIKDPVSHIFKNSDPEGSLIANVESSSVRSLSNMKLEDLLEKRHEMSQTVRNEVERTCSVWGYGLGSVYIRKVHFRDVEMIRQIEGKVINRLRQVTSAIKQDGNNTVNIISSSAEKEAAAAFAHAAATSSQIVGSAIAKVNEDPEVASALFKILELDILSKEGKDVTILPTSSEKGSVLPQFLAAQS